MYIRRITGSAVVLLLLGILVNPALAQSVNPTFIDFEALDVGESSTEPFTVSNNLPVTIKITSIEITGDATNAFSVELNGYTFPLDIPLFGSETFDVTFAPQVEGSASALLRVNGQYTLGPMPTQFSLTINLLGEGNAGAQTPDEMIEALIENFTTWTSGDNPPLYGTTRGKSKKTHDFVIMNMLLSAKCLINAGDYVEAYGQLESILKHVGVDAGPRTFVTGDPTTLGLFTGYVEALREALGGL